MSALINGMRNLIRSYKDWGHERAALKLETTLNIEIATNKNALYKRLQTLNQEDRDSLLSDIEFFLKYYPEDEADSAWSLKIEPILTGSALTLGDIVSDYRG